jgi:hypothetical protein
MNPAFAKQFVTDSCFVSLHATLSMCMASRMLTGRVSCVTVIEASPSKRDTLLESFYFGKEPLSYELSPCHRAV